MLFSINSYGYDYHVQKQNLDPAQLRVSIALTKELKTSQFVELNKEKDKLLKGFAIHQIFVSYFGVKTVGVVFLENKNNVRYPDKMTVAGDTVFHFPIKKTIMAVWMSGLTELEKNRIYAVLKNQIIAENQPLWARLIPQAYAQTCDVKSEGGVDPLAGKLNESGYSHCWGKLTEGVESYADSVAEDVKKKATLDFNLFEYWEKIKTVASGVANFASDFFSSPIAWIQKNVPNASDIDLSGLADIDKHQMLGLACLSVGREGFSSLVNSVVRGPAGLALKIFQMLSKITMIGKIFALLKKFASLSIEKFNQMKEKLVKLAEKMIKGEHGSDKADSINGLMKMSPAMAEEGLACMGI